MISSVHNRLFSPGGCLSPLAIRSYLDGSLRLSGRMQVEDHLAKCKFCSEALDGFKSRGSKNYLQSDVEYLTRKVRRAYHTKSFGSGRRMPVLIVFTLAVLLLVILLVFYVLQQNITNPKSGQKVSTDTSGQTRVPPADTSGALNVVKSE
jgi:hypothetical protein